MARRNLSREELFALVWEKPTREIGKELGISDVAVAKLCRRLQVPKPPRGYWARVQAGKTPRRPALGAFRDEVDRERREAIRVRAIANLSPVHQQFYEAALADLAARGIDVAAAQPRGGRLPDLDPDIAAQILLLIQNHAKDWVDEGKVTRPWRHAETSAATLVGKILPLARPQLLVFEAERTRGRLAQDGPTVLVRLTADLQQRIGVLARIAREQKLKHVVAPLMATDHAWQARSIYTPASHLFLDSMLCVSATEIWVECSRKSWREEDPPQRHASGKLSLRAIMPIDYMPLRETPLPAGITRATAEPYRDRLRAFLEIERVYNMLSRATYAMERDIPPETLALADRIWFGDERPFQTARQAWTRLQDELERWETQLEAERSALVQAILGIEVGDTVTAIQGGRLLRLSVTQATLYADDDGVSFSVSGTRFRKDGTLGKRYDTVYLRFEDEKPDTITQHQLPSNGVSTSTRTPFPWWLKWRG